ncbi:MAG: TonB-dependent receptor [Woeseiaceae bacterium]
MSSISSIQRAALSLFISVIAVPAMGQNAEEALIEELVVTAQYREQSVQDVPIAMSAFSDEEIARAGITDLQSIARLAPDFTAVNDLGAVRMSVRGIQSNSNDETQDQALVFNIDGDYINRPEFINAALFDLERVEVLRGPQGTLYGRNATGGAVNAIARKPSLDGVEGIVSADFGDYGSQILNGAVNFAAGESFAVRVAAMSAEHDGYNEHPNFSFDTNDQDVQAARIGFLIQPNDVFSLYLAAEQSESTYHASYGSINVNTPGFEVDGPPPGTGQCDAPGWVQVADFNPGIGCAPYNTSYLDSDVKRDNYVNLSPQEKGFRDVDATAFRGQADLNFDAFAVTYRFAMRNAELLGQDPLPGLVFYRDSEVDNTTHELRFSGGDDGGLLWQVGAFYFKEELDFFGGLHLPFGGAADPQGFGIWLNTFYRPDFDSESQALFGQVEIPFGDTITAVVGVRYTQDDKSGTFYNFAGPPAFANGGFENLRPIEDANVVVAESLDNNETTWTAGLNFTPNDSSLHYAKISKSWPTKSARRISLATARLTPTPTSTTTQTCRHRCF